jgi:hypothetical protein
MEDLLGKMQSMLSDPESMQQLQELAKLLESGAETSEDVQPEQSSSTHTKQPVPEADGSSSGGGMDFGKLMQLSALMGSAEQDEDAALLLALKPHLKQERQKKVDRALKLMKLMTVWKTLQETGLLKDFL